MSRVRLYTRPQKLENDRRVEVTFIKRYRHRITFLVNRFNRAMLHKKGKVGIAETEGVWVVTWVCNKFINYRVKIVCSIHLSKPCFVISLYKIFQSGCKEILIKDKKVFESDLEVCNLEKTLNGFVEGYI